MDKLCRLAFEGDIGIFTHAESTMDLLSSNNSNSLRRQKSGQKKDYKKLGFTNLEHPLLDFETTPSGSLALDCM